jgi:chemotaxis family two-component system response regulator Rcp1
MGGIRTGKWLDILFYDSEGTGACMTKMKEQSLHTPEAPWPDRMVVYLDLPKVSGREALENAKQNQNLGHTPMDILLVDDNPGDIRMMAEALKEALPAARLSVAVDGIEAMRFLRREGRYYKAPRPDLIFLDLRMPKKTGFDVLDEVKQDPTLASIPVVVQTSSAAAADVERAYSLHANCYITKPANVDEMSRTMRVLAEFWVTIAKLPDGGIRGQSH